MKAPVKHILAKNTLVKNSPLSMTPCSTPGIKRHKETRLS